MTKDRLRQPVKPIHPGEILLEEFLRPAGKSQAAFAQEVGWSRARLNELIKGKRGITAEAALDLAAVLWNLASPLDEPSDDLRSRRGTEKASRRVTAKEQVHSRARRWGRER